MSRCIKFLVVCSFLLPLTILSKNKKSHAQIIKPKTSFMSYSKLQDDLFYSAYHDSSCFFRNYRKLSAVDDKIVFYIVPYNAWDKIETKQRIEAFINEIHDGYIQYKNKQIRVFYFPCDFKVPYRSWYSLIKSEYDPVLWFSLISNNHKKIDMYCRSSHGFEDTASYAISGADPIAIILDEHDSIVAILDDVPSKKDIFKAFDGQ